MSCSFIQIISYTREQGERERAGVGYTHQLPAHFEEKCGEFPALKLILGERSPLITNETFALE